MSNWRLLSKKIQDEKLQPEPELDFFLSQLLIHNILPLSLAPLYERPQKNMGLLGRKNNLVWSNGGTETFNKILVHW